MSKEQQKSLIVDAGSSELRCGLAGDVIPSSIQSSIGTVSRGEVTDGALLASTILQQRQKLRSQGAVCMGLWRWSSPKELCALAGGLFEECDAITVFPAELCGLFYAGRSTGVLVDCGLNSTRVTTILEGAQGSLVRVGWDQERLDQQLASTLGIQGDRFSKLSGVVGCKGSLFVCRETSTQQQAPFFDRSYRLPDGREVVIPAQMRTSLYEPPRQFSHQISQQYNLAKSLTRAAPEIILVGGGSLIRGLPEKLIVTTGASVIAQRDRRHAGFIGAAIHNALGPLDHFSILKADVQEFGETLFQRKVF